MCVCVCVRVRVCVRVCVRVRVCTVRRAAARRTVHTHTHTPQVQNYAAKHRPSTRQTSVNHYEFQSSAALYSLMMDRIRSEKCWTDF